MNDYDSEIYRIEQWTLQHRINMLFSFREEAFGLEELKMIIFLIMKMLDKLMDGDILYYDLEYFKEKRLLSLTGYKNGGGTVNEKQVLNKKEIKKETNIKEKKVGGLNA